MSLDFEGVMRFFRVTLPRKYLSEEYADELIQTACSTKVSAHSISVFKIVLGFVSRRR